MVSRTLGMSADQWGQEFLDPSNWLPVKSDELPLNKKERYHARKKALDEYLLSDIPIDLIVAKTGVSRAEIYRILNRAFQARDDGFPVGYLACIPGYRLKRYSRKSASDIGHAGKMAQFLEGYPDIHKLLDDWALGKKKVDASVFRGRNVKRVWVALRRACIDAGIDVEDSYPFTNVDGGREAVRRYVKNLQNTAFVSAAKVNHGEATAKLARANGANVPVPTRVPYERVQLDGHRIDGIFVVSMLDPQGNMVELPLSRLWLLVMIDNASRCVLGYSLSLLENYSSEDVLNCIGSSFVPWKPKDVPESLNLYKSGAGLPSGVIPECAWRVFSTLQYDNAWSHLSSWVQGRLINCGVSEVVTIKPKSPRSDSIVERFMNTFESYSMHKLPNTTGSTPQDPRRRGSEKAAIKLNIGLDELEIITDFTIANYNATAHSHLNGKSPNEYLQYRISIDSDLIRTTPETNLDGLGLFDRDYSRVIRASLQQGHRPYIKFMGVRYSSDTLRDRSDLMDASVYFRVNIKDIRTGSLFHKSGEFIGRVSADQHWMERAHSISERRAILALTKKNILTSDAHQPLLEYFNYIEKQALYTRKARNKLLKLQKNEDVVRKEDTNGASSVTGPQQSRKWLGKSNRIVLNKTHTR